MAAADSAGSKTNVLAQRKAEVVSKYRVHDKDCGSPEVQIALLTDRLELLGEHFKTNPKDNHSRRGMMRAISRRKKMLSYLKDESPARLQGGYFRAWTEKVSRKTFYSSLTRPVV